MTLGVGNGIEGCLNPVDYLYNEWLDYFCAVHLAHILSRYVSWLKYALSEWYKVLEYSIFCDHFPITERILLFGTHLMIDYLYTKDLGGHETC